jgi:hypothetical protein
MTFSIAVWVVVGCWLGIFRRSRTRREPMSIAMELAALGTIVVPLVMLNMPYRLFLHGEAERATHSGMACHVLGERPPSLLLLCPERGPRPFMVAIDDGETRRLGVQSNVFDALASAVP